jgi:hypothetical protein
MTAKINHLAVIIAAIAYFVWGAVWYTLLGHQWQMLSGVSGAASPTTYVVSFLMGWVLSYVAAIALADSDQPNMVKHGISFGLFFGVGIWATNLLTVSLYEKKPLGLWAIDAVYVIIGLAIIGAIVGAMRKRA